VVRIFEQIGGSGASGAPNRGAWRLFHRPPRNVVRWARGLPEIRIALLAFVLNGVWEFLQSPLYADHARDVRYLLWTRLHCTVGDVFITLICFWVTSLLFGTRFWACERRRAAVAVFVLLGFSYTVWSEWFNTRVALSWAYTPTMPRILGIGITPLLQWVAIPFVLSLVLRRAGRPLERPPGPESHWSER
jgi:hypothetical protein